MTNISQHDLYPSTYDIPLPPIAGAQDVDEVLGTMEMAYDRLRQGWTAEAYIETGANVDDDGEKSEYVLTCSIGAILWASGVRTEPGVIGDFIEKELADTAKEAIRLLNEAAVDLYPWSSEDILERDWLGPLETVNQTRAHTLKYYGYDLEDEDPTCYDTNADPRKMRAFRVYEHAIQKRKDALVPA